MLAKRKRLRKNRRDREQGGGPPAPSGGIWSNSKRVRANAPIWSTVLGRTQGGRVVRAEPKKLKTASA